MTPNNRTKIYFQLAPALETRNKLIELTDELTKAGLELRFVDRNKWHLTVLHVGQLKPIWQQLRAQSQQISLEKFQTGMIEWAQIVQGKITTSSYQLRIQHFELFGGHNSVVAARFKPSSTLIKHHQLAYESLVVAWRQLGVNQPQLLMHALAELKFAHSLTPHVTLARDFTGDSSQLPKVKPERGSYQFQTMKFLYEQHE